MFDVISMNTTGSKSVFIQVKTKSFKNTQGWKMGNVKKNEVHPTFPWGKRRAMILLIDNPYEGGKNNERHGAKSEFVFETGTQEYERTNHRST